VTTEYSYQVELRRVWNLILVAKFRRKPLVFPEIGTKNQLTNFPLGAGIRQLRQCRVSEKVRILYADGNSQFFRGHAHQPIRDRSFGLHISWGGNKNPNDLHHVAER
jgi:hypothetical protein